VPPPLAKTKQCHHRNKKEEEEEEHEAMEKMMSVLKPNKVYEA
jgi:hypothetical protein